MRPPEDNVHELRYWIVRHKFGGSTGAAIRSPEIKIEDLEVLREFVDDVIKEKRRKLLEKKKK